MRDGKPVLRALGLTMLCALGVMVFGAVGAQASTLTNGLFEVNGSLNNLLAKLTGAQEGSSSFLVSEKNLTATCTAGHVDATTSEITNREEGLLRVIFLGCTTISHTKEIAIPCTVANPVLTAILLPKLGEGVNRYILLEQESGAMKFSGANCPLPQENPVTGTVVAQVTTNGAVVNLITFSKAITELFEPTDRLKFGTATLFITAKFTLELTGAHIGMKFGVV